MFINLVIIMKKLSLVAAALFTMTGAHAYQVELQGQAQFIDNTVNFKDYNASVQATYFLKDIDTAKGPLAEAAFLNQASNIALAYNAGNYDERNYNVDTHNYGVKGETYFNSDLLPMPIYASASYSHTLTDNKNGLSNGNGDRFAVEMGAVVAPNFLVAMGYTNVADPTSFDAFSLANKGVTTAALEEAVIHEEALTVRTKYVGAINDTNMSIGFETGLMVGADDTAYQFKTDLFFTPKFSTGVSFAATDADQSPDTTWGVNVNYFLTQAIAVGANYTYANAEKGNLNDTQVIGATAKFRF